MMINKEELEKLYIDKRMTQTQIGEMYNCDRKNIDYYLKKYRIPKRSIKENAELQRKTNLTINDIINMIEGGMLIHDICERYGVSRSTIYKITNRAGYSFQNHQNQTIKQADFMKINNPIHNENSKKKAVSNSAKTRKNNYRGKFSEFVEMEYKLYARKARFMAYAHFGKGEHVPEGCVIDHKYSVKDGFENKVPLSIISHEYNLRLIPTEENLHKSSKSIITLEELYKGVGVQRLSYKE